MNQIPCLLSTAYWPPLQYLAKFIHHSTIYLEQWENYPKQTFRNRCQIYGPNGIQSLIVPVEKGSFHKIVLKDLKIAYDTHWQKNHVKSIDAAYHSSPFYEYYIDDLMPLYKKRFSYLFDLNSEILTISIKWLHLKVALNKTLLFEPEVNYMDNRNSIHPKPNQRVFDDGFHSVAYTQGFEQRHGFIPNLSIIDLIFNVGPEAKSILQKSIVTLHEK